MLRFVVFPLLFILISCQSQETSSTEKDMEIPVIFKTQDGMFPESWVLSPINARAESLKSHEKERSLKIIEDALSKYPGEFVAKYLTKIYVLGHLEFYGVEYGGTNSNDVVYLCNKGISMGYSDLYLEQSFHHEFSSVLLRKHPSFFDKNSWIDQNSGFSYGQGGVNAIIEGKASVELSDTYAAMGVLSQYSTSDIEEDFNAFAEQLFSPSDEFWELVDRWPALQEKVKIIVGFYNQLDSSFTLDYFKRL